jgi:hypothetical protein
VVGVALLMTELYGGGHIPSNGLRPIAKNGARNADLAEIPAGLQPQDQGKTLESQVMADLLVWKPKQNRADGGG